MTRIALATCAALPDLHEDDAPLIDALAARGVTAQPAVWDDPAVAWEDFDLVVIRSTWDYAKRHTEFLRWAADVDTRTRLANPLPVIAWNTDKHYLRELESVGVPAATFFAGFAGTVELVGGILLVLGLLTPVVAVFVAIVMAGAYFYVHQANGIYAAENGWELVAVIGLATVVFGLVGPGRFSLDALIAGRRGAKA